MSTLKINKKGTGLLLRYGDVKIALDTGVAGETTLLSHSHTDHIGGLSKARHIIATTGTLDTLAARGTRLACKTTSLKNGDMFGQIEVNITPLNAGHVLGSSMFLMEFYDGLRVLYTGDFNVVDSIVHTAAKPIKADVLITEATYGTPEWEFPKREAVHESIMEKATSIVDSGRIPMFRAYSLGKAQEAIGLLQNGGFRIVTGNPSIDRVTKVYTKHGADLRHLRMGSSRAMTALQEGCVIITSSPRHTMNNIRHAYGSKFTSMLVKNIYNFNLSGWTLTEIGGNGFPLSAHTDFPNLIEFARAVQPRMVYCFTRNAQVFSKHLSQSGMNAVPLE
ncbi:MAG: MBL fold metallo-hydrolase [Candidatus Thorarchaeota archaeon]|jgi:putative mRNA 3-end processing factor